VVALIATVVIIVIVLRVEKGKTPLPDSLLLLRLLIFEEQRRLEELSKEVDL
jgi:hypothetical protein